MTQLVLEFPVRKSYGRSDFLISHGNRDAVSWLENWQEWPTPACILTGPSGSGKTHLLHIWQEHLNNAGRPVSWLSPSLLANFRADLFSATSTCILDDLPRYLGNPNVESGLFHLYNLCLENNGRLLISTHIPLDTLTFYLPDLASRLRGSGQAQLDQPDDDLIRHILTAAFSARQLYVPAPVMDYVVKRIERSFTAVQSFVDTADKLALQNHRAITIPLVKPLLET